MDNWRIKGNWKEMKGKLQKKYGELTDDDLAYTEGEENELLGRIQSKLGKSIDDVKSMIEDIGK
jgi:uncharacterized protein YjbJ (UPF0337 family)